MQPDFKKYMRLAIEQAQMSLREGNNGFGAVIVKHGAVVAAAHDTEVTPGCFSCHAARNAIRQACKAVGKNLAGCVLVSTHAPCPICARAVIRAGITEVVYGYSMKETVFRGGRSGIPCAEVFTKAGAEVNIYAGILEKECEVLYLSEVRTEIDRLQNADDSALCALNAESARKRVRWFEQNKDSLTLTDTDPLESAYRLLLNRLRITPEQAPVVEKTQNRIVFHSMNFCPTLEACKILKLDTRHVCKRINENATDTLIRQIDGRLRFSRNYQALRPYTDYCEEVIGFMQGE